MQEEATNAHNSSAEGEEEEGEEGEEREERVEALGLVQRNRGCIALRTVAKCQRTFRGSKPVYLDQLIFLRHSTKRLAGSPPTMHLLIVKG